MKMSFEKMKKQAKIYVAGHGGLVGSAIIRALHHHGYTNIVTRTLKELDLRRQHLVEQFFAQEKPTYVFLAAAKVGGILANNIYKARFIYDNLMIATNVIHASYKHGVKKLLNLALLIKNIVGFTGNIKWDATKPDGTPRKLLDVSKIHTLGWRHTTTLEDGIKKVYNMHFGTEREGKSWCNTKQF